MIKPEAQKFWDSPNFKRQQELIAGPVPWETSEKNAALHRTWVETPLIKEYLGSTSMRPCVAELGCGVGRMLKEFVGEFHCAGLDISDNMLKKAEKYLEKYPKNEMMLGLIKDGVLPLDDDSVNFLYSFLVFQHIQTKAEIGKYMGEISRVLVPGGYFRVQTLKGEPHSEEHFGGFHGRFYPSLEDFKTDLDGQCGLEVVEQEEGLGHPYWLWLTLRRR